MRQLLRKKNLNKLLKKLAKNIGTSQNGHPNRKGMKLLTLNRIWTQETV